MDHSAQFEMVEVRSPQQLAALATPHSLRRFMSEKRLLLRIPSIEAAQQEAVERRLNFWLGVCGCQPGALFFLATLAWQIAGNIRFQPLTIETVLRGGAFVLAAGILGKAAAVLLARLMFIAETAFYLWRIRQEIRERPRST